MQLKSAWERSASVADAADAVVVVVPVANISWRGTIDSLSD